MPLDFPATPTNGQQYQNWIYSTSKGAWQSKPLTPAKTLTSATPPSSPSNGDQWFNTNDGTLYIYLNDGNSSQWVEARSPITADGYKSPNYCINGAMDIWQRGVGPVSAGNGGYTAADRWYVYNNAVQTTTVAKETTIVPPGFASSYKLTQTGTSSTIYLMQSVETANAKLLEGKTVTLSAYVYGAVTTTFSIGLRSDAAVDKAPATGYSGSVNASSASSPAGAWTRISTTGVVPAGTNTLRIDVYATPTLGQPIYITGVQLEEGVSATTFRRNTPSVQAELAACQRYYYRYVMTQGGSVIAPAINYSATSCVFKVNFPVSMRVTPTSFDSTAASTFRSVDGLSEWTGSSITFYSTGQDPDGALMSLNTNASTQGKATHVMVKGTGPSYIGFSAEL